MPQNLPATNDLQLILPQPLSTEQLESAISDAALVFKPCAGDYDSDTEAAIIKYLAAHMLAMAGVSSSLVSETVDGDSYRRQVATTGEGLKGTQYGQQVLLLDHKGCLSRRDLRTARVDLL